MRVGWCGFLLYYYYEGEDMERVADHRTGRFSSVSRVRLVYLLRKSTEFHVESEKNFLLVIFSYHSCCDRFASVPSPFPTIFRFERSNAPPPDAPDRSPRG